MENSTLGSDAAAESDGGRRMIGRDRELRSMRAALRPAPSLVLVVGEAGIGKSRLVREAARDSSLRWLVGHCRPVPGPAPLAPIAEALGDTTDVVGRLSGLGPAVLLIEDVHWADAETLQLLRFVASRLPRELTLVVTYRPEDTLQAGEITALAGCVPEGTRTTEVRLLPLTASQVRELAQEIVGVLPGERANDLFRRTGGIPFVVEELLRNQHATHTPVALRASVNLRLEQVSATCRRLVWAAAVLDSAATDSLLGAVADIPDARLAAAVDTALARALLGQPRPGVYDLRHALAQRAIYEIIPEDERRRLHRRAAAALTTLEPPPHIRIAHHCRQGGLLRGWMTHAELAADSADAATAAELLSEMLRADVLPSTDRARLAVKLARTAWATTSCLQATRLMRSLLADPNLTDTARGRLRVELGLLLHDHAGDVAAARNELTTAVTELTNDPEAAAHAMAALSIPTAGLEPMAEHRTWLRRASRTAPAPRISHATFLVATGDPAGPATAQRLLDEPATAKTRADQARSAANIAGILACLGRHRDSALMLDRATEIGGDLASVLAGVAATRLRLAFATGDWKDIADRAATARAAAEEMPLVRAEIDLVVGRLRLAQGDVAGARQILESVAGAVEGCGPVPLWAAATATLGRLHLTHDQPAVAFRKTERCVAAVRAKEGWVWSGDLVPVVCAAMHRLGRRDDAHALASEFSDGLTGRAAPAASAAAVLARACLAELDGDLAAATELYDDAAARYRGIGRPYDTCIALEGRATCLLANGDSESLTATAVAYEVLGARWDSRRCRDALRQAGVPVSRRRGRRGYGNALSPRERQVAQLAARGLRNVTIAEALSLSVSTVEDHLSRAMRKLNVQSRQDLAPLIPEQPGP